MRTKVLLGLAVLAASALTVAAQNVYSLNVVGYVSVTVPAGTGPNPSFVAIGNPLKASPDNTVATVFGATAPGGISLLTWNGASFDENICYGGMSWDVPDDVIAPGRGFFVKNPGAQFEIKFVGEVLAGQQTNVMDQLFSFVASKVPVAGNLQTDAHLNLVNAVAGDSLLTWNGSSYDENIYYGSASWDVDPIIGVAPQPLPQAFFYKQPGPTTHTVNWVTIGFP